MSLFADITAALEDPRTTALIMQSELDPGAGPGTVVSPPTYAADQDGPTAKFAFTPAAPVPERNDAGWFHGFQRNPEGSLRHASRAVVNSLGAEAGACESGLYHQQQRLGVELPAFVVGGHVEDPRRVESFLGTSSKAKGLDSEFARQQLREALTTVVSSWEMPHRQADAWIRYAEQDGEQLWKSENETKQIIQSIGLKDGPTTYRYAPNSAIYGAWLSSGTPVRQAIPRAYASEITGYGASPVYRSSVKLDAEGGASSSSRLQLKAGELATAATGGKAPSNLGFGQVPGRNHVAGFTFELLLRQASISVKALRHFQYADESGQEQSLAATRVYVLLAMAGHLLSGEDLFLRSGCDLVNVGEQWGWRRHGQRDPELVEVPSVEEVAQALREALEQAATVGLEFADPIQLSLSVPEMELIAERMLAESKPETSEGN